MSLTPLSADNLGLSCVVIDAGHGGKDPGCVSADKKTYEKSLTLDIANKLATKIREAYPDVNVVLTRESDKAVALDERATIANKAKADLFISLHINSTARTSPNGFSIHVLGQSTDSNKDLFAYNMDVCRRENEVITLEEDYTNKYEGFDPNDPESFIFMSLMQNAHLEQSLKFAEKVRLKLKGGAIKADRGIWQNGFMVLWRTAMPSILVELGFMSNPNDLAVLRDKNKREDIAQRLFLAFREYKIDYDESLGGDKKEEFKPESSRSIEQPSKAVKTSYAVQIAMLSKELPSDSKLFLGYRPKIIKSGKFYKYYISISESLDEVKSNLKSIRKTHPDAFVVSINGENVSPVR